jgi:hypothetical protein
MSSTKGQWKFEQIAFDYGYLRGPNKFEFGASENGIEMIESHDFGILGATIICNDDHAASVTLMKTLVDVPGEETGWEVQVSQEQDIDMRFSLPWDESFDTSIKEMNKLLGNQE